MLFLETYFKTCFVMLSCFLFFVLFGVSQGILVRGPYLQIPTPTSIFIRWRTNQLEESVVRYGISPGVMTGQKSNLGTTIEHGILLPELLPNTKYYYSIGSQSLRYENEEYFFTTAPTSGPVRMLALGDPGTGYTEQSRVLKTFVEFSKLDGWAPNWAMILGDNGYSSGTDDEYQKKLFNVYRTLFASLPYYAVIGNHDMVNYKSGGLNLPYFLSFVSPTKGEAGGVPSSSSKYYSYDYGDAHITVLDSETSDRGPNGIMARWLKSDLQSTTKDWIIVVFHHPPYTKGSHDSDASSTLKTMRANFNPIIDSYGVDLVITAHSHSYERSYLIQGHYELSNRLTNEMIVDKSSGSSSNPYLKPVEKKVRNSGAVYVVIGCSGKTSGGSLNHPVMYKSLNVAGYLTIDVGGSSLEGRFVTLNGEVADHFVIMKSSEAKKVRQLQSLVAVAQSEQEVELKWENGIESMDSGYQIKRCEGVGCNDFAKLFAVSGNSQSLGQKSSLSFTDFNVHPNTTYSYVVVSYSKQGYEFSSIASVSTATPNAPTNVRAQVIERKNNNSSGIAVLVRWDDNSSDEVEFQIKVCGNGKCRYHGVHSSTQEYKDIHVEKGVEYEYYVIARNMIGSTSSIDGIKIMV
jgi:acid phosphatase type 7